MTLHDVLLVEADLPSFAAAFYIVVDLVQHLVLGFIKQAIPGDDFRILHEQSPELDEVTVAGPMPLERSLHELVELPVTFARSLEAQARRPGRFLVVLAKTRHPPGRDALGVAGAQRVQQRAVALIEEQDAVDVIRLTEVRHQAGPERAHLRMKQAEGAGLARLQVDLRDLARALP